MLEIDSFKICEKSFTLNQHYLKTPFQELNLFLEGVVLFISIPFKYLSNISYFLLIIDYRVTRMHIRFLNI